MKENARGKLLLFGEHAVVYGYPGIGVSIPWHIKLTAATSKTWCWESKYTLKPSEHGKLDLLLQEMHRLFPHLKKTGPYRLQIGGTIPLGVGFGSSAALCICCVRLARRLEKKKASYISEKKIHQLSHTMEKIFHARPSGIDTGVALQKKLCYVTFKKGKLPSLNQISSSVLYLVVGSLKRRSSTGQIVSRIAEKQMRKDKKILNSIETLGSISHQSAAVLKKADRFCAKNIGTLADTAQKTLKNMGLSTKTLDSILCEGKKIGALGGKLSGAGCGGAFYLVAENKKKALLLRKKIASYVKDKERPVKVLAITSGGSYFLNSSS